MPWADESRGTGGHDKLKSLGLSYCYDLTDIEHISKFPNLTELTIGTCPKLVNLTPLQTLGPLERISLPRAVTDEDLRKMREKGVLSHTLKSIRTERNARISDLTPLAGLANLESAFLDGYEINDLSPLANLPNLKSLGLGGHFIVDLTPLAELGLIGLSLNDLSAVNLEPVADLGLKALTIGNCRLLEDLTPLAKTQSLIHLTIEGCPRVSDITPLAHLKGLRHLDLSHCTQISDVTPLAALKGLDHVTLEGCERVSDEQVEQLRKALPHTGVSGTAVMD